VKVAWLADAVAPAGGAELTASEFRAAAPSSVDVVECPPNGLSAVAACDVVCVHNTVTYPDSVVEALQGKPVLRYWHDLARPRTPADGPLLRWCLTNACHVFTSPLHRERFPWEVSGDVHVVPPAIALSRYRTPARKRPRGACWLGSGRHGGKGLLQACEWAEANEPVDFWGHLSLPETSRVRVKGTVPPDHVATILRLYERFVFLPTHTEPFGRAVVEAWAAGCELIVNRNVGALHWLSEADALESAARDYWALVAAL
jgi:glycosyltransferase involved in cell wall biosynthesis